MAETGISDVASVLQAEISSTLQSFLIQESKLLPTVTRIQAQGGRKSVDLPKMGGFTVGDKSENVAVTLQEMTTSNDQLLLNKEKVIAFGIEDRARDQSMVNLEQAGLERAAKAMALQYDIDIIAELEQVTAGHQAVYDNATSLGQEDILEAKKLLAFQNIDFAECYIGVNPEAEKSLLGIADFVHADRYAGATALMTGELGRLYGAPVIASNEFDALKTMFWHKSHVAMAEQRVIKTEKNRDTLKLSDIWVINNLYGTQVLDSGVRGVVRGTA